MKKLKMSLANLKGLSKDEMKKITAGSDNSCNYRCDNGYTCSTTCLTCEYATGYEHKMCVK